MDLTEDLVSSLVKELTGGYVIQYHADGPQEPPITIDFTPGWVRQAPSCRLPHLHQPLPRPSPLLCRSTASTLSEC